MAEESGGDSWWGAWGTELLTNVRTKSAETLSLVRQDLAEFVTTIQHDTTITVAETANTVKEKLKVEEEETDGSTTAVIRQGVSHWLGSLSTTLKENVSQMTAIVDEEPSSSQAGLVFDRVQARVHEIQTDPATYCNEPDGHPAHYEEWCTGFDLDQYKADISELLVNKPEIRSLYTKLVPSAVTNSMFWTRYFYKMHKFHQEEKRKAALVERANKVEEEDLDWDDEEESWDIQDDALLKENKPPPNPSQNLPTPEPVKHQSDTLQTMNQTTNSSLIDSKHDGSDELKSNSEDDAKINECTSPADDHKCDSSTPLLPVEQAGILVDDTPRESSTPDPCLIVPSNPDDSFKCTHTESNISEGKQDDLHRENDSSSSVDSSWSKLSDEDLKQSNTNKNTIGLSDKVGCGTSPSQSERSSSSVVVVPPINDNDLDWDDDDDINNDSNKAANPPPDDDDDDDWENWE